MCRINKEESVYRLFWGQGHSWLQILFTAITPVSQRQRMQFLYGQHSKVVAGGGSSIARDLSLKGCETPTPFVTTEDVTQLLHSYCLCLGYPFTNISKETKSQDFLKRDRQGDLQAIQADL